MDAGSSVCAIAVSKDGKWVVSGSARLVTVWNAQNHSKVTEWKAHDRWVCRVDVSPDGTRIATGSDDNTLCIWSLSTAGERLLGALKHDHWVLAVKFSPNGRLIATAACDGNIRVYDSRTGGLIEFPSKANSNSGHSLTWATDNDLLFVSSSDGNVIALEVSTRITLSKWAIHSSKNATCIALPNNGGFVATSAGSSISFWDIGTREQIGSVIEHTQDVVTMGISTYHDLVVRGDKTITIWRLCDILPSRYFDNVRLSA